MKHLKNLFCVIFLTTVALVAGSANAWEFSWNDEVKASANEKHAAELRAARLEGKLEAEAARRAELAARADADLLKSQQTAARAEAARKGWHIRAVKAERNAKKAQVQLASLKAKHGKPGKAKKSRRTS
jgi:hypothetical protein